MNSIDLKPLVAAAIKSELPAFAREHPHLAAALDQTILVEQATKSLAEDPEFIAVMSRAGAANLIADALHGSVSRFVHDWIGRMI